MEDLSKDLNIKISMVLRLHNIVQNVEGDIIIKP